MTKHFNVDTVPPRFAAFIIHLFGKHRGNNGATIQTNISYSDQF